MKKAMLLLITVFSASGFASELPKTCYQALNPQNITVKTYKENALDGITRIDLNEAGKSATLNMIFDSTKLYDENGSFPTAVFKIRTRSLVAKTSASDFSRNGHTYAIECDGGSVTLHEEGHNLIANTDYLTAEAFQTNTGECAGDAALDMKNVVFKPVSCAKNK